MTQPDTTYVADHSHASDGSEPSHILCFRCSYDLVGLDHAGVCPECGMPVEDSVRAVGKQLVDSSPEYLASLRSGVKFILYGILCQIAFGVLGGVIVSAIVFGSSQPAAQTSALASTLTIVFQIIGLLATTAVLWGWWKFSTPNPAFVGLDDGGRARQLVRVAVVANLAIGVTEFLLMLIFGSSSGGMGLWAILSMLLGLVSLIVLGVSFFSQMLYVRWLAPQIPNAKVAKNSKRYLWLIPVLSTVGVIIIIGPLIALVLYWNMLDKVRKDLARIAKVQAAR